MTVAAESRDLQYGLLRGNPASWDPEKTQK